MQIPRCWGRSFVPPVKMKNNLMVCMTALFFETSSCWSLFRSKNRSSWYELFYVASIFSHVLMHPHPVATAVVAISYTLWKITVKKHKYLNMLIFDNFSSYTPQNVGLMLCVSCFLVFGSHFSYLCNNRDVLCMNNLLVACIILVVQ